MPDLLNPIVLRILGPYFAGLILVVLLFLSAAILGVRALLKANVERQESDRRLQETWQNFLGNHMSENVRINQQIERALCLLTERLASLEARISECPKRT